MELNETAVDGRGARLCRRHIDAAVPNDPSDLTKGHHYVKAFCNKPVSVNISENRLVCPSCDKPPVIGWVAPRTLNANNTASLTPKEMEECGLKPDGTRIDGKVIVPAAPQAPVEAQKAVEAKVEIKKDVVAIEISLDEISSTADIAGLLIRRVSASMDTLPVTNFGESKRLIKLQEKLEQLLAV